jgi:hypothetical protein
MSSVKDLFLKLTKTTMPSGHEHLVEKYLPKGWKKDFHGNYYIQIGDPTVMFTCHVDTADSGQPKEVTHVIKGDVIETDGKTILGADDKAGTAIMIYMIEKKKTGLYYFFLSEERGCVGSRALNTHLVTHKNDDLYKKIDKVVSLDRRDFDSVITFQVGERCCSVEFADELAKRLNEAGGFKYKKDPTGSVTDSHQIAEKFPECTNLSVGYDNQHTVKENQDVAFLQKLADVCIKIDWETLPIKRDPSKVEYSYSTSRSTRYHGTEWESDKWWESGSGSSSIKSTSVGPGSLAPSTKFVTDYLGNQVAVADAQWCEYDKQWCPKVDAIWVDYIGFYTTPDFDPAKVKKPEPAGELTAMADVDIKKGSKLYTKNGELFGTVLDIGEKITLMLPTGSKFIIPMNKLLTYNFYKKSDTGTNAVTVENIKPGMIVNHPSFGQGKVEGVKADRLIAKIMFKDKGEKDVRVDVAGMKF